MRLLLVAALVVFLLISTARADTSTRRRVGRALDGTHQWAYQGKPLYVYHEDKAPGDVEGDNKDDGSWHVVTLKGS